MVFRFSSFRFFWLIILGTTAALIGCTSAPTPTPALSPTPFLSPTPAPTAIPTGALAPTLAPTPAVIPTPTAKMTPTRVPTVPAGSMRIKLFFVALNDNGASGKKIGCGDSIIAVDRIIPITNAPLRASLNELFSFHNQYYGQSGLYNALYQSTLKVENINLVGGTATIYLSGKVMLGGVCDNPRFEAQIKETALQFSTVKDAAVFVNSIPLEKILSEKGG